MGAPLAAASDLVVEGTYDVAKTASALSWATSVIEAYCKHSFGLVTDETVVISPHGGSGLLPNFPVVQVTLVEGYLPDGQGMAWKPMTNYWLVADTGELFNTIGLPGVPWNPFSWPWLPGSLRVTYDHGYEVIPNDLRDVCARLAGQYLENPELFVERRVGDMEGRFSGSAGVVFGPMDKVVLDKYSDGVLG